MEAQEVIEHVYAHNAVRRPRSSNGQGGPAVIRANGSSSLLRGPFVITIPSGGAGFVPAMELAEIYARVDRSDGPDACHEWQGARLPPPNNPYGMVRFQGKPQRVHRLLWTLERGAIPDGLFLLHSCDNPPCCNLRHLSVGTHQRNVQEAWERGLCQAPPRRLTAEQVEAIRSVVFYRGVIRDQAREFGVSELTIRDVRRGRGAYADGGQAAAAEAVPPPERRISPHSALTERDAAAIRAVPYEWGLIARLSRQYGVSHTTIRKIRSGERYR